MRRKMQSREDLYSLSPRNFHLEAEKRQLAGGRCGVCIGREGEVEETLVAVDGVIMGLLIKICTCRVRLEELGSQYFRWWFCITKEWV
mmetsp:Transcript_20795/g.28853  ORF Transcript_20795/g.28853 Transcript_20795/m.28853 type:complete len:88 (+) Transcript_20795:7128-7391(+)